MRSLSTADTLAGNLGPSKTALFANPFRDGEREALVIDQNNYLTYVRPAATPSGWEQVPATADGFLATEVVVVVHPRDRTVWAICARGRAEVRALRLVETVTAAGEVRCSWEEVPDAIDFRLANEVASLTRLRVSHNGPIPLISGTKAGMRTTATIRPYLGQCPFHFLYSDLGGDLARSKPLRNRQMVRAARPDGLGIDRFAEVSLPIAA